MYLFNGRDKDEDSVIPFNCDGSITFTFVGRGGIFRSVNFLDCFLVEGTAAFFKPESVNFFPFSVGFEVGSILLVAVLLMLKMLRQK